MQWSPTLPKVSMSGDGFCTGKKVAAFRWAEMGFSELDEGYVIRLTLNSLLRASLLGHRSIRAAHTNATQMLNAESILLLFQVAKIDYCKCYGSWGHAKDGGSSITCHLLTCCRLQECCHRPGYTSWPRVCWPLNPVSVSSLQPSWDDKCLWFLCMMQGCIIIGFPNLKNCKNGNFHDAQYHSFAHS